ncbi:hypothetical protein [uncultured Ruminococcus sp.]|uniref:hypothetical protein n=1 Tax=uncultured Ruminococcus sp. TaxID=165186 RepID=UPI002607960F|nr:hypothetical protein [uncultured Ruminococcus sp.]
MHKRFIECAYDEYVINDTYKLLSFADMHISEVSSFVAEVYYNKKHYKFEDDFEIIKDNIHENDERLDRHSFIFCLLNRENDICCTLKLFKKDSPDWLLPIEEEFGIDLNYFEEFPLLEIGRFASNGNISFNLIVSMFKRIIQVVNIKDSRLFASLDKRVYKQLLRLKYPIYPLGNYRYYMGTDTIPVGVKVSELLSVKLGG